MARLAALLLGRATVTVTMTTREVIATMARATVKALPLERLLGNNSSSSTDSKPLARKVATQDMAVTAATVPQEHQEWAALLQECLRMARISLLLRG